MSDVSVRNVAEDEWTALRDVRLASLAESPSAFTSTLESEQRHTPHEWRVRAGRKAIAWAGEHPVGTIGWSRHDDFTEVIGLWVHPDYRGQHVSDKLVDFVRGVPRPDGHELRLAVKKANAAALAFYRRIGFEMTQEEVHPEAGALVWMRDGQPDEIG